MMTYHAIMEEKERNKEWHRLIWKLNYLKQCSLDLLVWSICICLLIESRQSSTATDHDLENRREEIVKFNWSTFVDCFTLWSTILVEREGWWCKHIIVVFFYWENLRSQWAIILNQMIGVYVRFSIRGRDNSCDYNHRNDELSFSILTRELISSSWHPTDHFHSTEWHIHLQINCQIVMRQGWKKPDNLG